MKRGLKRDEIILEDGRKLSYVVDRIDDKKNSSASSSSSSDWIFLFHGMFGKSDDWIHKKPLKKWNCVYVDRPGYGKSDRPIDVTSWTYGMFAQDMEQLANVLNLQHYYVAGHSSGGPCALACGAHSPTRVIGIVVIAGDPEYAAEGAPREVPVLDYLEYRWLGPSIVFLLSLGNLCGPFAGRLGGGPKTDYIVERKLYDFETESIQIPTLFFHGKQDSDIRPAYAEFTHSRIPGSELIMVNDADHMSIISYDNLNKALSRIVKMVEERNPKKDLSATSIEEDVN